MWVRRDDGGQLVPIEGVTVFIDYETSEICAADTGCDTEDDGYWVLSRCPSPEDALARMDDVTAWLNAEIVIPTGKWESYTDDKGMESTYKKHVVKPVVYEFSRAIGHWKEGN